jgi:dTDP-4-dehydrorhamnose 3,5-epimerase
MNWTDGTIDKLVVKPIKKYTDQRGWLAELYRTDEIPGDLMPQMGYISVTHPGMSRGPHAHVQQTDVFGFLGPGSMKVILWDNRPQSHTYGTKQEIIVGEDNPVIMIVPPGLVHGYINISDKDTMVLNFPNSLYRGNNKSEAADEIRYEEDKNSPFTIHA